jgi:hypothetical protein
VEAVLFITHRTSPSRHGADGSRRAEQSVNSPFGSTSDGANLVERNFSADLAAFFAPYQPLHGPDRDLDSEFGRTLLALSIRRSIDNREDRIASLECQYHDGRLCGADFLERYDEAIAQLRRHRFALFRLNELGRN